MKINFYTFPGMKRELLPNRSKAFRKSRITPEQIIDVVAKNCNVKPEDIIAKIKTKDIAEARHIVCAIMRNEFGFSVEFIGKTIGGRDHSTAVHSTQVFKNRLEYEHGYKDLVNKIMDEINDKINYLC